MQLTYYGHSCFLLETGGKSILFDPFISANELATHVHPENIRTDYVFLSHGHQDHMADLPLIMKHNPEALLVASWELCAWANSNGIANTHPMNIGGSWNFPFGRVKMVFAAHSNSLPDGSYGGISAGFVFFTSDGNLYYAGDTALTHDMQLLSAYSLKAALLPIGSNFTMDAEDAAVAAKWIGCKNIIGMHYDTFGYIKINHADAVKTFEKQGAQLHLMNIGSKMSL